MAVLRAASLAFVLSWIVLPVVQAVDSFESMPESVDGVLIADVGDNISLTCNQTIGIVANWRISSSLDCTGTVVHGVTPEASCDVFNIRALSVSSPYITTAVANASLSMTGSMVECTSVMGQNTVVVIGQSITLCILQADDPAPPLNLDCQVMSDGVVRCTWSAPASLPNCIMNKVSYNITVTPLGDNTTSVMETRSTVGMEEIFMLVPGEAYQTSVITVLDLTPPRQSEVIRTNYIYTAAEKVTTLIVTLTTTVDSQSTKHTTSDPLNAVSVGVVAVIAVITAVVMLAVGVVIGALTMICIMKKRSNYNNATDNAASSGPVYDELSQSKVAFHDDLEMDQNIAYGPVKHGM